MCSWQLCLVNAIKYFKTKAYNFNQIADMNIVIKANKMDCTLIIDGRKFLKRI